MRISVRLIALAAALSIAGCARKPARIAPPPKPLTPEERFERDIAEMERLDMQIQGYGYGGAAAADLLIQAPVQVGGHRPVLPMGPAGPRRLQDRFNTEEYARLPDRPFSLTTSKPLSTMSIDVDTASYANVRRYLGRHRLPPRDAVRIEELINYFDYAYPEPAGEHPLSVNTAVSRAPWAPGHRLIRVGLQARRLQPDQLPPANLTFLIDVSGSMRPSNKLPLLQAGFRLLTGQLRPDDQVAIVVYAGRAGLILPPTPGDDKQAILQAINGLSAGGSTAGGEGLKLAYEVAEDLFDDDAINRVILATDGDFNVGVSSTAELTELVESRRKTGIQLTVLGFGQGNYKDHRMEELSNRGDGNAAYIDNLIEAEKVLVKEMAGTLATLARDVKVQVEFNPAHVKAWRLIGYDNRRLAAQDFNDDTKDAGELGAGHSVTALYELIPAGSDEPVPGIDSLKYQTTGPSSAASASGELMTVKVRYKPPAEAASKLQAVVVPAASERALEATSDDFRFATAVAEYGLLLRNDPHAPGADWTQVVARARASAGPDANGYRHDFVRLAETARILTTTTTSSAAPP